MTGDEEAGVCGAGTHREKPAMGCGQVRTSLAGRSHRYTLPCAPQSSACCYGDFEKRHYRADSTRLLHDHVGSL